MYLNYIHYLVLIFLGRPNFIDTSSGVDVQGRIVRGQPAKCHSIPYQVAIYLQEDDGRIIFCGGSLITFRYVLTAAHCLSHVVSAQLIFGAHCIHKSEKNRIYMKSRTFITHKYPDFQLSLNNIALIKLPSPITLSKYIAIVKLPSDWDYKRSYFGEKAILTGWGVKSIYKLEANKNLQQLDIRIVPVEECVNHLQIRRKNILCGFGENGGVPCMGDDGGPLVIKHNNTVTQIGIILYNTSTPFCSTDVPIYFTKVAWYIDWIKENSDYK